MTNKLWNAFGVLFIISTIVFVGWKDIHPESVSEITKERNKIHLVSGYYMGSDAKAEIVPDDQRPVTIYAGSFNKTKNNKIKFLPRKSGYLTFAQRQVSLSFKIEALPDDFSSIVTQIKESLKMWKLQGNDISAIFLDYRPKKPSFKRYVDFTKSFRKHIPNIHIIPSLSLSWLNNKKYSDYKLLKEKASFFMVIMGKNENIPKNIEKLSYVDYGFKLRLPKGYTSSDVDAKAIVNSKGFGGAMAYIDSARVIKQNHIIIGVFPKF